MEAGAEEQLKSEPTQAEQHAMAAQRAEQLAAARSLEAGLAGGVAHVRLEAGSGLSWRMTYLACPATAAVHELSEVRGRATCGCKCGPKRRDDLYCLVDAMRSQPQAVSRRAMKRRGTPARVLA